MPLPTEEQRLAAKLLGVDEEWAASHFDEWFDVFWAFNSLDEDVRDLADTLSEYHEYSYKNGIYDCWANYREAMQNTIRNLKELLDEYAKWFSKEDKPFSYYQQIVKEGTAKSHED